MMELIKSHPIPRTLNYWHQLFFKQPLPKWLWYLGTKTGDQRRGVVMTVTIPLCLYIIIQIAIRKLTTTLLNILFQVVK